MKENAKKRVRSEATFFRGLNFNLWGSQGTNETNYVRKSLLRREGGNTTISRNRFRTFTEYATLPDFSVAPLDRADNPIAGFPDNIANAGLVYVRNGLNAEIYLAYVGKAYVDNSGGTLADGTPSDIHIIDSYTMVDMVAGYEFPVSSVLANLRLNVALNNVLNQKVLQYGNVGFPDPQFFPAATRHVYAGLRYTIK